NSGFGNGPFGLGWDLSVPSITRKTEKRLPRYQDAEGSDVFILSEAEDLLPALVENAGQWDKPGLLNALLTTYGLFSQERPKGSSDSSSNRFVRPEAMQTTTSPFACLRSVDGDFNLEVDK